MMYYRDMTFCKFYVLCKDGDDCHRALTPEVIQKADEWWGKSGAPICSFAEKPDCFINKTFRCDDCKYDKGSGFIANDPCDGCDNYSNFKS